MANGALALNLNLIPKNKKVVVALSGGVDSSILFHVLKKAGYDVIVAHVNHKKRQESEMEEEKIIELCKRTNTPYEILHLEKIDKNFEAKAHKKRYSFFIDVCKKHNAEYIATAHHQDDNVETIIMNILGGSNIYGYGGIAKELIIDDIHIVRPLLACSKESLYEYAKEENIIYYEDITNASDDYLRNRIRHHIVPILKNESSSLLKKTASYSNQLHEAFDFIRDEVLNYINKYGMTIDLNSFNSLHSFLQKEIICYHLEQYKIVRSEQKINDILSMLKSNDPQKSYSLKDGEYKYEFIKRYDRAWIQKYDNNIVSKDFNYILNSKEDIIDNNHVKIYFDTCVNPNAIYLKLCYNELVFPISIRNRKDGDKIKLAYGYKKIKDLMIDKKIIKEQRDLMPIVVDGKQDILWVYNICKAQKVKEQRDRFDIYLILEVKNYGNNVK